MSFVKHALSVEKVPNIFYFQHRKLCNDILPSSETVIVKNIKLKDNLQKPKKIEPKNDSKEFRVNDVNIQMISKNIYEQLFKGKHVVISQNAIER